LIKTIRSHRLTPTLGSVVIYQVYKEQYQT